MSPTKLWIFGLVLLSLSNLTLSDDNDVIIEGKEAMEEVEVSTEEEKEYVITLDESNFNNFISTHKRTLVEFYAPWCGHCKALAPKYEEAAKLLSTKQSDTKLAKIDATENPDLTEQFSVTGYPTLFFIDNGETVPYDGGRETKDIVDWVLSYSVPPYTVYTMQQFEDSRDDTIDLSVDSHREFEIFGFIKK